MSMLLSLLSAKLLPLLVPPLVAAARAYILKKVPPKFLPVVITGGAALVDMAATALGVEGVPADLAMLGGAAWEGALIGLAGVGIHQVFTKVKK